MTDAISELAPKGNMHNQLRDFWAKQELRFQQCSDCGRWRHMPREHCPGCNSSKWEWARSAGQGTVHSWTVCHRAFHPSVEGATPYAVAMVEFEKGVRLMAEVVETDPDAVTGGMAVEVCFKTDAGGNVLPKVRPRAAGS